MLIRLRIGVGMRENYARIRGIEREPRRVDRGAMSESRVTPGGPAESDIVEILDRGSKTHVKARVAQGAEGRFVLELERAAAIHDQAPVRWYDGETAWQASSQIVQIDETSVNCQLAPPPEWEPAPVRQSLRAAVDNAPMLVRTATGKRVPCDLPRHLCQWLPRKLARTTPGGR